MTSPRDGSRTGTSKPFSSSTNFPKRVLVILGTRPEAIKLCPVISAVRSISSQHFETVVCVTGQHRGMLDQVLAAFELEPDYDLDLMKPNQSLSQLSSRLLAGLEPIFAAVKPSLAVVQGDTTTTLCGALAAFYARVPVAHVEAGLRTFDMQVPFPQEMNRVLTGRIATLHFAATKWAAGNLLHEGVPANAIQVTGNTGIDAVLAISKAIERGKAPAKS
jgi:UDP-N-acetylglucosamine 2-epimerase (non-hydrolysing)